MTDSVADRIRSLLASDVYSEKGRLRSDDLLVRERACKALSDASARLRDLESGYRATRVPPSTRENPFPSAEVMAPLRQSERLGRDIEDMATRIRGLPLLSEDRVWDRLRRGGLHELLQFDWALIAEAEALAAGLAAETDLSTVNEPGVRQALSRLAQIVFDRRRYTEMVALHPKQPSYLRKSTPLAIHDDQC